MTVQAVIPSYLYKEYDDDDDLQGFVAAQNKIAQQYLDWFNSIGLPYYPGLEGDLLDWVAQGLYGLTRPVLPYGTAHDIGPLNSWTLNSIPFNTKKRVDEERVFTTSDDTFKRILTWAFFKGDGKVFGIRWLKRRIMQFLEGVDGIPFNVDQTYRVSVTFGVGSQVDITILNGVRTVTSGAMFNTNPINSYRFNGIESSFTSLTPFPYAPILKAAIDSGALELPFQMSWVTTV